jgi:hypothetical protein
MKTISLTLSALAFALFSLHSHAAVSEAMAAELGKSLTPTGAELAGNADGSIPAWQGGLATNAGIVDNFSRLSDPFADEMPLFTITSENVAQYQEKLSAGHLALFKRYPTSFKMPVYPSHRTARLPESVNQAIRLNATQARLVKDGNGLEGFTTAIPFPVPQTGIEIIWNHITRYRGGSVKRNMMMTSPMANGSYVPIFIRQQFTYPDHLKDYDSSKANNVLFYYMQAITSPARLSGNVLLVHETLDQVKDPRKAWLYAAGQRRVRRAPQVAYDGATPGSEGQRVADNLDMFNGAPDRYDWKLLGKRELYIPYNGFKLQSADVKYSDIIRPGHINPQLTRYELHRVWVVEATLKPGERHIYAKRVMFIDEDTWQIAVVDHYDGRNELWRVAEGIMTPVYDKQIPWLGVETLYDLMNGRYLVSGLRNEEQSPVEFGVKTSTGEYTPSALRNMGVR